VRTQGKIREKRKRIGVAYSEDLRKCLIKAHEEGQESVRKLAQRFQVGKSFVGELIQRYQQTGSYAAKPHGKGEKPKIGEEDLNWLKAKVIEKNDSTLEELCRMLESERDIAVSQPTMCRALQKIGLTRKKKLFMPTNKKEKKSNN
jgi:transposase